MIRWMLILIIIAALIYLISFYKKDKKEKKPVVTVRKEKETPATPEMISLSRLKDLNVTVRLTYGFDEVLRDKIEQIIDKLWKLVPRLNNENSASEMTWVVNKMSREYLHELVEKYIRLEDKNREKMVPETMTALVALLSEIETIDNLIQEMDLNKLKTQAKYLKTKFFRNDEKQEL